MDFQSIVYWIGCRSKINITTWKCIDVEKYKIILSHKDFFVAIKCLLIPYNTKEVNYTQYNEVCVFANAENRKYKTREHVPLLQTRMFLVYNKEIQRKMISMYGY
jgi:hypothetical protein